MQNTSKLNLQQIQQFLHSSEEIRFKGKGRAEIYTWVARTLRQHGYSRQNRADKGLLRQYLVKMTGLSRAQITRLIQQYRQGGELQPARYRRHRFARKYTPADVELLAAVDEAHETLSGPATRKILEREYQQYQQREYERLAWDLGGPDLSPAAAQSLPPAAAAFHQDPAHGGVDRRYGPTRKA